MISDLQYYQASHIVVVVVVVVIIFRKTPTFLYWATQQAKIHDSIEYIVKCDSDTMLRYAFLLRMMHKELPWNPARSTVLGAIRHKAIWNETTGDESFWEQTYFHGMHLYLGGQFFLMSMDLALAVVSQAQNYGSRLKYLEGHEDVSQSSPYFLANTSMIIVVSFVTFLLLCLIARHIEHDASGKSGCSHTMDWNAQELSILGASCQRRVSVGTDMEKRSQEHGARTRSKAALFCISDQRRGVFLLVGRLGSHHEGETTSLSS